MNWVARRGAPRPLIWTLVVAASAVAGLAPGFAAQHQTPAARFAIYVIGLAVAIVVSVLMDTRRRGDLCSPLVLTAVFYFLAFVVGTTFFWVAPHFWFVAGLAGAARTASDHAAVATATGLCLLGWIGLALGYELRIFRFLHLRSLRLDMARQDPTRAMWLLWAVGFGARAVTFSKGGYFHTGASSNVVSSAGTLSQALTIGGFLPLIAVAYAGVMAARTGDRRWRRLYRCGLLIELAYAAPSGTRGLVATVVVTALLVSYYGHGRLPWRSMMVGAVVLFVAFPVLYLERSPASSGQSQGSSIGQSVRAYLNQPVSGVLQYSIGTILSRFSDIVIPAALVEKGEVALPAEPVTVVWLLTDPIPRALWPSKPDSSAFGERLPLVLGLEPHATVPIATTQVGEMFLDFGAMGVLIGLFVVGGMLRELGEWLGGRRDRPAVTALYAAVALQILGAPEKILAQGFGGLVRATVVLAAILWIAIALSRRKPGVAPPGTVLHAR